MESDSNSTVVPPDQCNRCGAHTGYPWLTHWAPGATMLCDGEPVSDWEHGGPVGMSDYVRDQLALSVATSRSGHGTSDA